MDSSRAKFGNFEKLLRATHRGQPETNRDKPRQPETTRDKPSTQTETTRDNPRQSETIQDAQNKAEEHQSAHSLKCSHTFWGFATIPEAQWTSSN